MNRDSMEQELVDLEHRLAGRTAPGLPGEFRYRVIRAVADELEATEKSTESFTGGWYWGAIAAAALIALNLSMMDGTVMEFKDASSIGRTTTLTYELKQIDAMERGVHQ